MNKLFDSNLLESKVFHKRCSPTIHQFTHEIFYLVLNLKLKLKRKLFSIDAFNIFSLFWDDYGFNKLDDPEAYVYNILDDLKFNRKLVTNIMLMTMPKILGYSFNPISFWLCFDNNNQLIAVLAEVNNTFNERHAYLCFNQDGSKIDSKSWIVRPKVFHVSPFCEIKGYYNFRFDISQHRINIDINYYIDDQLLIATNIKGLRTELTDGKLIKYFFKYFMIGFKVIFLIHYHAFRLWLKKVPYFKKPIKINKNVT